MYIKSIVLDGFKSYGRRVEIKGFDTQFNAITGLNGTGKSNILDSICFVLGITNLSHVRAGSLQDLIYKSGQAGVTKASVSITFDNTNPEQSPPGYESCKEVIITRQVVMGGKNKYWINGVVVQNKKVQDLFCSVQLNVNNPHFLIMQGRVTKVLNMKPHEILSMLEESAGTKMYETKRQVAQKTIEKKDQKLKELQTIFMEDVCPKLEKLRKERQAYLEFLRIERELEHMTALHQGWLYYSSIKRTKNAEEKLQNAKNKVKSIEDSIESNKEAIESIAEEVKVLSQEADKKGGGKLKEMEESLKALEKQEAKQNGLVKSSKENIISEEKKIKQLEKNIKDDAVALVAKEKELASVQNLFDGLKKNDEDDTAAYALAQKKYEAICSGMDVNEDGEAATLEDQMISAKKEAAQAATEMKSAEMMLTLCRTQLTQIEKESKANSSDCAQDRAMLQKLEKEVKSLQDSLSKLNYSEERLNELQQRSRVLRVEVKSLRDKVDNFEAQRPFTKFSYRDPEPNFNRNRVSGVVCNLIKLKDNIYSTALEKAAGGRLYNVIVEDEVTGKALLERGQLQKRTTFIPLNKIQGKKMDDATVHHAQNLVGKENVKPALSLIQYDKKLQPAMEFIFGNVFICADLNAAKRVTFHNNIRKRCVTLEGDVTDPGGTLSGGARSKTTPVLLQLDEIRGCEMQLRKKERELAEADREMQLMQQNKNRYENLKNPFEIKQHELETLTARMKQTASHQQQQELEDLKQKSVELQEKVAQCKKVENECHKKAKELASTMKNVKGYKEAKLKAAENEMKTCKEKAEKSKKEWQKREEEYASLKMEISELAKTIENTTEQLAKSKEDLEKVKENYEEECASAQELKERLIALQAEVKAEKDIVHQTNVEINQKNKKKEKLSNQISELQLEIQKFEHEINKLQEEFENAKSKESENSKKMKNKEKSLQDAKDLSDKEGIDLQNKIAKAQEKRGKLGRTVNAKAQSMFEHEEKQYNTLVKKISIVESDKKNLLSVIASLDKQKKESIQLAYNQVRKDLGSIFSTLLPDANATLEPPLGKTIIEGLEVKVCLGGVWKDSLNELSGGQRSLVALSLILAMLLFKPAPLYILDEVDAALDLNHTQNIGNMLKSHFKQSQFIIVSLKDGMFNNANVLYRTKFLDGMSTVQRSVNRN